MNNLKMYLKNLGASKIGFADVDGLAKEFVDLPNGISIVLKLPKETIQLVKDEDYKEYWKSFHKHISKLTDKYLCKYNYKEIWVNEK